jgi:hypothetical protein
MMALKNVKKALSTNKVVGEKPTFVKTDSLAMVLDKRDPQDILGGLFGSPSSNDNSGASCVRMPTSLPLGESAVPLDIEVPVISIYCVDLLIINLTMVLRSVLMSHINYGDHHSDFFLAFSSLINWHTISIKRLNKFKIIHHRPIAYDCITY